MHRSIPILTGLAVLAAAPAAAGADDLAYAAARTAGGGGHLVVAILGGLALALAFQLLLTNLSVAGGLSAFRLGRGKDLPAADDTSGAADGGHKPGRITAGLGLWMLITSAAALFAASWLAVELSATGSRTVGFVIGLIIWAGFLALTVYWETIAVSSLLGMAFRTAAGGVKAAAGGVRSLFGMGPSAQAASTAGAAAAAVRRELLGAQHPSDVQDLIRRYVDRMRTPELDWKRIRHEVATLLEETGIAHKTAADDAGYHDVAADIAHDPKIAGAHGGRFAKVVEEAIRNLKAERAPDETLSGKALDAVSRWTGADWRARVEDYLRRAGRDELDPLAIERELDQLLREPRTGWHALAERAGRLDRQTVAALLSQRQDMTSEDAERAADRVVGAVETLRGRYHRAHEGMGGSVASAKQRLRDYLQRLDRPELDYEGLAADLRLLAHEPRAGVAALRERWSRLDRATLLALVQTRSDVTPEDAERIVSRIESIRDRASDHLHKGADRAHGYADATADAVAHGAEDARRGAARAAWWMFGASAGSAAAAGLAGILAAAT